MSVGGFGVGRAPHVFALWSAASRNLLRTSVFYGTVMFKQRLQQPQPDPCRQLQQSNSHSQNIKDQFYYVLST